MMGESLAATSEYGAHLRRLTEQPGPPWLKSLRTAAFERFQRLGYPTSHQESWRYTNPAPFAQGFPPAGSETPNLSRTDIRSLSYDNLASTELVFVNGAYAPALSSLKELPPGIRIQSLSSLLQKNPQDAEPHLGQIETFQANAFAALNTAFFPDGAFIDVPRGARLDTPIHLLFVGHARTQPSLQSPRVFVRAGPHAQLQLIETYTGFSDSQHVTNAVTELLLEEGAKVQRVKVQREPPRAHHLQAVEAEIHRDAVLIDHNIALGAKVARTDIGVTFQDQGGDLTLNGLYVLKGDQHVDNHTLVDHARPNCQSREFYKGILDGTSRGVFYGKVIVRKDAQKTNASQTNKNLLLSDGALVDSTPALEINADDVKCSHGSTIGQLDRDAVFYLQSRGLDEATARSLLTFGFARDILTPIKIPAVRAYLEDQILARLPQGKTVKEALRDAA